MPQLFRPAANSVLRVAIVLFLAGAAGAVGLAYAWSRSDAAWNVGVPGIQPIPFRHDLHAGTLDLDCGYCHISADRAASAGMPTAQTCLTCHSQVWVGASVLEPLHTSLTLNQPVVWTSVHRLPDYAYFHHGAHVANGVACATCHGDVADMPKTVRVHSLSMGWCLDCHRDAGRYAGDRQAASGVASPPLADGATAPGAEGDDIAQTYQAVSRLTDCNTCHR